MLLQKSSDDIFSECKRSATVIYSPSAYIGVWIGPQEVANQTYNQNNLCVEKHGNEPSSVAVLGLEAPRGRGGM